MASANFTSAQAADVANVNLQTNNVEMDFGSDDDNVLREAILGLLIRRDPVFHSDCVQRRASQMCTRCAACGARICDKDNLDFVCEEPACCGIRPRRIIVKCPKVDCRSVIFDGCRNTNLHKYRKIGLDGMDRLKDGDEVALHRSACACFDCRRRKIRQYTRKCPTVFHHVIYSKPETDENPFFIGFDEDDESRTIRITTKSKTQILTYVEDEMNTTCCVDLAADDIYVIEYPESLNGDSVSKLARKEVQRMNNRSYNLLRRNCEHFARWTKTGVRNSSQAWDLWKVFLNYGLFVLFRVFLAIVALTIIELELPDDTSEAARSIENKLIDAFCLLYGIIMVFITVFSQVRRFIGKCTWRSRHEVRRNLGLYTRVIVEALLTWMLPMILIIILRLVDWPPFVSQWTDVAVLVIVTVLGTLLGWLIGRFVGRSCEQCCTRMDRRMIGMCMQGITVC